jgi:hypothetical protein
VRVRRDDLRTREKSLEKHHIDDAAMPGTAIAM